MCVRVLSFLGIALTVATQAVAAPIQWTSGSGGNDHWYDFVLSPSITWTAADLAADASSFMGMDGHLATITSSGENDFLINTVLPPANQSGDIGPWFGASQADNQAGPGVGWSWVTGEAFGGFTYWRPHNPAIYPYAEPNDVDTIENNQENFGHFHAPSTNPWFWNDAPNSVGAPGYLVEYEPAAVPEPATLTLFGLGVCLAGVSRRRQRSWQA